MEIQDLKTKMRNTNWMEWLQEQKRLQIPAQVCPTSYNISTITTNCRIYYYGADGVRCPIFINYLTFFRECPLTEHGIEYKKYRFRAQKWMWPDIREHDRPSQKTARKNSKLKGVFYNQITLEVFSTASNKIITTFLYDNGSMNNTGNKLVEDTHAVSDRLIHVLTECNARRTFLYHYRNVNLANWDEQNIEDLEAHLARELVPLDLESGRLVMEDVNVSTMNAKYNAGIKLNRDNLYRLIKTMNEENRQSNIYLALLETSNYAGLNIKVRWSANCGASEHAKYKRKWRCGCSDITILAFQSGEVMISGAKTVEQINYVKGLFDKLIADNLDKVFDVDLQSIISIPNQKRIKRVHKYLKTTQLQDRTFVVLE